MKRVTVTITLTLCLLLAWAIGASHAATPVEEPSDKIVGTIRVGVGPFGVAVNPYTRTAVLEHFIKAAAYFSLPMWG